MLCKTAINVIGKEVVNKELLNGSDSHSLDVSGLTEGTYLMIITDENGFNQGATFVKSHP